MTLPDSSSGVRTRILIADDNQAMRDTVIEMLDTDYDIVAVAADGRGVVDLEAKLKPEIGIIDIAMPSQTGLEAAAELKSRGSQMRIVFLTVHDDPDYVSAAVDSGAAAYVVKREMGRELRKALSRVSSGLTYFPPYPEMPNGKA